MNFILPHLAKVLRQKQKKQVDTSKKHTFVAYFLYYGNTKVIADQIHEKEGGDVFKIKTLIVK